MPVELRLKILERGPEAVGDFRKNREENLYVFNCPVCPRKFDLFDDRAYIVTFFQSGKHGKYAKMNIGFICPDCTTHTFFTWQLRKPLPQLIELLQIYNPANEPK